MARITVHLPKFVTPRMEEMFIIVPEMGVNFPSDFKIKAKVLSVRSKKAAGLYGTVSSPTDTRWYPSLNLTLFASRRTLNASLAISTFQMAQSVGTSQLGTS